MAKKPGKATKKKFNIAVPAGPMVSMSGKPIGAQPPAAPMLKPAAGKKPAGKAW